MNIYKHRYLFHGANATSTYVIVKVLRGSVFAQRNFAERTRAFVAEFRVAKTI